MSKKAKSPKLSIQSFCRYRNDIKEIKDDFELSLRNII